VAQLAPGCWPPDGRSERDPANCSATATCRCRSKTKQTTAGKNVTGDAAGPVLNTQLQRTSRCFTPCSGPAERDEPRLSGSSLIAVLESQRALQMKPGMSQRAVHRQKGRPAPASPRRSEDKRRLTVVHRITSTQAGALGCGNTV
jgi:hypothetical protein